MITWNLFGRTHYAALRFNGVEGAFVGKGSTVQEAVKNCFNNLNFYLGHSFNQ